MVSPRNLRVLIVDDDPAVGRSLARMVGTDAAVDVVASGAEALERIERGDRFDLVVCDVMMPDMTGPQLFDRVRALDPGTAAAFTFMTGGASPDEESEVHATGARCLAKPIELAVMRLLLKGCGLSLL